MMTASETADYIRLRMTEAGCSRTDVFDAGALREIHRYSGGVPRKINVLADHCLVAGFAAQAAVIPADLVASVAEELQLPELVAEVPEVPAGSESLAEQYQLSDLFRAFLGEEEVKLPEMTAQRN
jgi:general secretion pathway protein A